MSVKPVSLNVVGICRFSKKDIDAQKAVTLLKRVDETFCELSQDLPVDLSLTTEVTFSSEELAKIIDGARKAGVSDVIVGTVTNTDRLEKTHKLGIKRAVAPDFMLDVLQAAKEYKIEFVPGITHLHEKRTLGEEIIKKGLPIPKTLKVFPFSGTKTPEGLFNALKAPYASEIAAFEASGGKIRFANDGETLRQDFVYSPTAFAMQLREKTGRAEEIVIGKPYTGMDGLEFGNLMSALAILERFPKIGGFTKDTKHGAFGGVKITDVGPLSKHGVGIVGLGNDFLGSSVLQAANLDDLSPALEKIAAVIGSIRAAYK